MRSRDLEQNATQGGTALQAGGDIVITSTGLSYTEIKEIALDVFRANFYQLSGIAKQTASDRAEEITEAFLSKLQVENPEGFQQANDPSFQYALLTVQKEHARIGDKDLGDLLVDLLVDRSKHECRDILQIVLDESLNTAPKLTDNQLAVLAITFLFRYTQHNGIGNHQLLGEYFDKFVIPFGQKIVKNAACYQHLEFTGCGAIGPMEAKLETILGKTYQGQFLKGFDPKEVEEKKLSVGLDSRFFIQCLNDKAKVQVRANNHESLDRLLADQGIDAEDSGKVKALFDVGKMGDDEIKEKCVELRPYMSQVFDVWSDSNMKNFTLTSVGIAIAHANVKRLVGEFADLAIWIN